MKDGMDRERMLDINTYLLPTRKMVFGLLGVSLASLGPWLGWWTIVPVIIAAVGYAIGDARIDRAAKPEISIFAAWCLSEVVLAVSVQLSGGVGVPTLSWLALPVVTLSYRFPLRGVMAGVGLTLFLMLAIAALDFQAVIDYPPVLVAPIVLLLGVTIFSIALMNADQNVRKEAVIDSLTGMLNRHALATRIAEMTQQSKVTGQSVGIIVVDLDHFKEVNDNFGHATGDAVLKDVAYTIRKQLRAFDLAYRIGGEEFLILLPGADSDESARLAEGLRQTIEAAKSGGRRVTLSAGVSVSNPGEEFNYDALFAGADAALYEAKNAGRNRVHLASADAPSKAVIAA